MIALVGLYIVALLTLPVDIGINVAGTVVTPSRIVLLVTALVALVQWRSVLAALRAVPASVWLGWAAFLGATLVTALVWPSAASWARYGSLVLEGVGVFTLVIHAASTSGGLRALAAVFAATLVGVAAVVLVLALMGQHYDHILSDLAGTVAAPDVLPRYGLERQAGPFRAPLYFGIWMVGASSLLLPAIARGARNVRWLAFAGWLVLLVSVVFLTASRLAATTIFVLPGLYFLARGPRLVGVASLLAAGVVAVGLGALIPAPPTVVESNSLRLAAISPALQAISARPLFGWGLLSDQHVLTNIIGTKNFVDNTYLSLAIETGLVGLAAFLFLACSILAATRPAWRSALGLALAVAVLGVLAMGILASILQASQGYAAFAALAALAVSLAAQLRVGDKGRAAAAT